ncbi:HEAT repeat domain-containing protein [Synechococcus sp. M16CYN]|uniref:HEAT repeat domain-containing protein n=1 Tax=Synechococcus sp. M16CYN TaxID=3103139 RepID=UPI0032451DBD
MPVVDDRRQHRDLRDLELATLSLDPDLLARELAAEETIDPLDEFRTGDTSSSIALICDQGLVDLCGTHNQRLQGLQVFCEYKDPRAAPLLLPLLQRPCPVERMSAVYALGRNPSPPAVEPLLQLLQLDSNAYVRKAAAWSLGNYPDAPILNPLIRALQNDVAAVRLWCPGSLAESGSRSPDKADPAASQLIVSLQIDSEPVVRSNCIWALGRLIDQLVESRQNEIIEILIEALLYDGETSVRDEARTALEQLGNPMVLERIQILIDNGLII